MAPSDERAFVPVNIAILTVSDTRDLASDKSGRTLQELAEADGHHVVAREIVTDDTEAIANAATAASTAFPPSRSIEAPASAVRRCPAATAPRVGVEVTGPESGRWTAASKPGLGCPRIFRGVRLSADVSAHRLTAADFELAPPELPLEVVIDAAARHYGLDGEPVRLTGERDLNLRFGEGPGARVLKVSGADERDDVVDLQIEALLHLEREAPELSVPRVVPTVNGARLATLQIDLTE